MRTKLADMATGHLLNIWHRSDRETHGVMKRDNGTLQGQH